MTEDGAAEGVKEQNLINTVVTGWYNFVQTVWDNREGGQCFGRNKKILTLQLFGRRPADRNMSHHGPLYRSKNANVPRD